MKDIVNFLFEIGILSKTPRSGFHFLGSGNQSVSEHTTRTIFVGYALASMIEDIDVTKILKMCLFHDLAEARTSDLNYVHQKYAETKEKEAIKDTTKNIPFGKDIEEIIEEYEKRETKESLIAKDADQIEFILSLKEEADKGNLKANDWLKSVIKRLKTDAGKKMAEQILKTDSDEWWFGNKEDSWWVDRNKNNDSN